ncbi:MAG: hypothetical protein JST93_01355 [Acidobacteria bacterium]|nr:hypothetical protein [Acidobacteriota bacterium]
MVLSPQEEALIRVVRTLPPEETVRMIHWANQLCEVAQGERIQWSDSWSDEDVADAARASLQQFDDAEQEGT